MSQMALCGNAGRKDGLLGANWRAIKGGSLKSWAMKLAKRASGSWCRGSRVRASFGSP